MARKRRILRDIVSVRYLLSIGYLFRRMPCCVVTFKVLRAVLRPIRNFCDKDSGEMPQCRSLDEVVAIHSFLPLSQSTRNLYPLVVLRLSEAPVFRLTRLTSVIHSISSTIWTYRIHISLLILLMSKPVSLSDVHIIDVFFLSLTARKPINPEHDTNKHTIHTYTSYVAYVIVSLSLTRLACLSMIHVSLTIS